VSPPLKTSLGVPLHQPIVGLSLSTAPLGSSHCSARCGGSNRCAGTINCHELKAAMQSLGFESKNRTIYSIIAGIAKDHPEKIDFETFLKLIVEAMEGMGDATRPEKVSTDPISQ
jgi:hypothetical protein